MMRNWYNPKDRTNLLARLGNLRPDSPRKWGTMTAGEMVCHVSDPVRAALGDKPLKKESSPIGLPVISTLAVWVAPWPKGAPTSDAFIAGRGMTPPDEFLADKAELLALLQRFTEYPEDRELGESPVFGRLSRRAWGRLQWRHLDHHLRQFSC